MTGKAKGEALVIGAESRAHLLPPEVLLKRKGKVVRRRLGFVILLVAFLATRAGRLVCGQLVDGKGFPLFRRARELDRIAEALGPWAQSVGAMPGGEYTAVRCHSGVLDGLPRDHLVHPAVCHHRVE